MRDVCAAAVFSSAHLQLVSRLGGGMPPQRARKANPGGALGGLYQNQRNQTPPSGLLVDTGQLQAGAQLQPEASLVTVWPDSRGCMEGGPPKGIDGFF